MLDLFRCYTDINIDDRWKLWQLTDCWNMVRMIFLLSESSQQTRFANSWISQNHQFDQNIILFSHWWNVHYQIKAWHLRQQHGLKKAALAFRVNAHISLSSPQIEMSAFRSHFRSKALYSHAPIHFSDWNKVDYSPIHLSNTIWKHLNYLLILGKIRFSYILQRSSIKYSIVISGWWLNN